MQCQSYLPVYQSDYDLNVDINRGSRVMYDGNGAFLSGHCKDHVSILQVPQSNFDYKGLLWQTMLMHEVTFRDQVQELHRLYKRHRDLLTEIKSKEINTKHLELEVQSSNSSSQILSSSGAHETDNIQRYFHCTEEFKTPVIPLALQNDGSWEKLPGYKGKIIAGKPLDLELPAEVYIDSDEWDSLQESQDAEDPTSANLSSSKHCKFIVEADGTASRVNAQLQGDISSPCSIQGTKCHLVDLNEPPITLHFDNSDSHTEVLRSSSDKKPFCTLGKKPFVVQALPSLNSQSLSSKNAKYSRRSQWSVKQNLDFGPSSGKTLTDVVAEEKYVRAVQKNGMSEVSISCENFVCTKQNGTSCVDSLNDVNLRKSKRCKLIDINLPCDPASDDEQVTEDDLARHDYKNSGLINLNICSEVDLEAPVSPQVMECSPPRGHFEENQLKGDNSLGELAKVAAQAIVSMSCKTLSLSETKDYRYCKVSDSKGLEWFAGLVNDVGTLRFNGIDDFEAMTLNLTETKSEENIFVGISSHTCSVSMIGQARKGRMRRPKIKKDFQREVLPALASLSRYEVTEDMQIIEGLMEAAGTPWHLRTRRACRMGRKPQVIKQLAPPTEFRGLKDEFGFSWGKDNRRPRGHRSPLSPDAVKSRWLGLVL